VPATAKHKVRVEKTKSDKWLRLRGVDSKLSVMIAPADMPDGVKPDTVITMTLSK